MCLAGTLLSRPVLAAEDPVLEPGSALERQIRGGETQSLRINAIAGQFLDVVVDQKGIDVTLALISPDSRELARSDLPNATWGPERIAIVLTTAGNYEIAVSAANAKAAPGLYVIHLVALREATASDLQMATADAAVRKAENLRRKHTEASRRQAIEEYEIALGFFRSSGDRYREALTLKTIGLLRAESGDFRAALTSYDRAIAMFHELGEKLAEAMSLNNAGGAYDVLGEPGKARESYEQALVLTRSIKQHLDEAVVLNNIGSLYYEQSDWQKSIEYYRQAQPLFHEAGDRRGEAFDWMNLGYAYEYLGDTATARDYLQHALELFRASGDRIGEANTLNAIGESYRYEGRVGDGLGYYQQALEIYRAAGDRRREANCLYSFGVAYSQSGERAKALDPLQQAVALAHATGDRRREGATLGALAHVFDLAGDSAQALETGRQSLAILRTIGDRNSEATTLLTIADAYRKSGNLAEARSNAEAALERIEGVRGGAGSQELRASYLASKEDAYAFMIDLLMESGKTADALETSERSRARSTLDMLAESRIDIRESADPKLVAREREIAETLNAKGARLLTRPKDAALQKEIRELESEYQEVQGAIRKSSPRYAALSQPQPLDAKRIQTELLDADTLLVEYALGETHSYVWAIGANDLHAWTLPPRAKIEQQVERVDELLTAPKHTAEAAAKQLSDMILAPVMSVAGNRRLVIVPDGALQRLPFAMLPVADRQDPLIVSREVVMLPSASALAALRREVAGRKPAPKMLAVFADPVFDRSDPRVNHAAAAASNAPPEVASRLLEHLGESTPESVTLRIPRLPYTAQEADQILRVARDPSNLKAIGFQASRTTATDGQLSDYRYIHFATHGYLDTERPGLSALVLSQIDASGRPVDGFLRVDDIYNARLSADLVVLSACETGLGKEVRGEGLMGLTRAFLYAGAARVIVTLWSVNDRATAELMSSLYRGMLRSGLSPAAALRQAQLEMRKQKRWESPYYWAAFVEQGEWR